MNLKVFIGTVAIGVLAAYLILFTTAENFNLPSEPASSSERFMMRIGFLLALPTLALVYIIDHLLHPHWAAIYTWALGSLLSAALWSFAAQQLIVRYKARSATQTRNGT